MINAQRITDSVQKEIIRELMGLVEKNVVTHEGAVLIGQAMHRISRRMIELLLEEYEIISRPPETCPAVEARSGVQCGQPLHHRTSSHSNGLLTMGAWGDDDCTEESLNQLTNLRKRDKVTI